LMFRRKFAVVAAVLAVTAVFLVGCSSSSQPGSGSQTTAGTSPAQGAGAVKSEAEAMVKTFMTVPNNWPLPTTRFKPGHFKAVAIGCGFTAQACEQPTVWAVDALHAMGWSAPPAEDGQNSTTTEADLVAQAVQQKYNGIIFTGIDVNTIPSAVNAAAAAGVKMMCVVCVSGPRWKGKVVDVTPNWYQAGVMAAWEVLSISGSATKAAQFYDPEFSAIVYRDAGVEATFKKYCPSCTLDTIHINGEQVGEPGPPPWTAFLASHPPGTINNVIAEYDGGAIVVSKTDQSEGRSIPVGSYDGEVPNLTGIATGQPAPITWTVGQPYDYEPWAAADALGRWVNGLPIPAGLNQMPLVLVTSANVHEFLKGNPPPSDYIAPLDNWQAKFKALWIK
jgi:ABC-type sugar transport system substrate-binding protein